MNARKLFQRIRRAFSPSAHHVFRVTKQSGRFTNFLEFRNCPICGRDGTPELVSFEKDLISALIHTSGLPTGIEKHVPCIYARCRDCDLLYVNPCPLGEYVDLSRIGDKAEWLRANYNSGRNNDWMEDQQYIVDKTRIIDAHYRICEFDKIDRSLPVLDYGCGTGVSLSVFHERGFQKLYGIEPDLFSCEMMRMHKPYINAFWMDAISADFLEFKETFALVMLDNVLEHALHPKEVVNNLYLVLRPGGKLWISVPNLWGNSAKRRGVDYENFNFGHWSFFSPPSLAKLFAPFFTRGTFYAGNEREEVDLCNFNLASSSFRDDWIQVLLEKPA